MAPSFMAKNERPMTNVPKPRAERRRRREKIINISNDFIKLIVVVNVNTADIITTEMICHTKKETLKVPANKMKHTRGTVTQVLNLGVRKEIWEFLSVSLEVLEVDRRLL